MMMMMMIFRRYWGHRH